MSKRARKPAIIESDTDDTDDDFMDEEVKPKRTTKRKVAKIESDEDEYVAPKKARVKKETKTEKPVAPKRPRVKKENVDGDEIPKKTRVKKEKAVAPKRTRVKKEKVDEGIKVEEEESELNHNNTEETDSKSNIVKCEYDTSKPNELKSEDSKPISRVVEADDKSSISALEDRKAPKKTQVKKDSDETNTKTDSFNPRWDDHEIIQYEHNLDEGTARRIINLFKESNTVPFIARYRKNETGNMTADELRCIKESIDKVDALKSRMKSVVKILEKSGKLTNELRNSIMGAPNLEILEHLYSPYKQGTPHSLVERAKVLGLEPPAVNLLEDKCPEDLKKYTNDEVKLEEVEKGVEHIMAHVMATNMDTLSFLQVLKKETGFSIETKKAKKRAAKEDDEKPLPKSKVAKVEKGGRPKEVDESKFQNYIDYKNYLNRIKPHQILAINRGEHLKILSVKIGIPDFFHHKFVNFCKSKWLSQRTTHYRSKLILDAVEDAYTRIITPLVTREIRAEMKSKAEKASLEVFSNNLKQILLAAPTKGKKILGIDPGFTNGCKIALISETGSVLETGVIYPLKKFTQNEAVYMIRSFLLNYSCTIIALGNGTACRETESWLCDMISNNVFRPLDVTYTIVSECGASIYSCSKEAKKEFPDMDPNLISAVSLARRIQEPLAELVKVEPKHLGVGMYQHDLAAKPLEEALNDVVSECVSFVGVDLNTASQCLLKHVAGLTDKKASDIIKYREEKGPFSSREDLKKVKGIGANTFQQCAGFLKVTQDQNKSKNKLDHTIIHPEAYDIALQLIKKLKLDTNSIGEDIFISTIRREEPYLINQFNEFNTSKETLQLILEALSKPINYDLRDDINNQPLFKKNLTTLEDLSVGTVLTGRVSNVTHFGCFVDIGVKINGLIHISQMKNRDLKIGDRVEVNIANLELERKRIGLELLNVI